MTKSGDDWCLFPLTLIVPHVFLPLSLCWILATSSQHFSDLPRMYLLIAPVIEYIERFLVL